MSLRHCEVRRTVAIQKAAKPESRKVKTGLLLFARNDACTLIAAAFYLAEGQA